MDMNEASAIHLPRFIRSAYIPVSSSLDLYVTRDTDANNTILTNKNRNKKKNTSVEFFVLVF
jgi:hypothetical protein